jgi:hypothetical protein
MRRSFLRAAVAFAACAPLGLALSAAADPETEEARPPTPQERPQPAPAPTLPAEATAKPPPPAPPVEQVPDFDAPDPSNLSVIDPNNPPPPGKLPSAAEMEEKAKREAVGRQTEKLEKQSAHGVGQSYFGGGIY